MLSYLKLKQLRIACGVKQKDVSDCVGVSPRFVKYVESGERDLPPDRYETWLNACLGLIKPDKETK